MATVYHHIMVHYASTPPDTPKKSFSLKAGLKRFGARGKQAVTKELTQLNIYETFTPFHALSLSLDQRRAALPSLIFLVEKRTGEIKARACANGSKQRDHHIAKEEATSPTVNNDSTFVLAAIAAHKCRVTATMDLPGAFLHADNDDLVIMKMTGKLAELMS